MKMMRIVTNINFKNISLVGLYFLFSGASQANHVELWQFNLLGQPDYGSDYIYSTKNEAATEACLKLGNIRGYTEFDHVDYYLDGNGDETDGFICRFAFYTNSGDRYLTGFTGFSVHSTLQKCGTVLHYDVVTGQCVQNIIEKTIEKKSLGSPSCDLNTQAGKDN